MTALDSSFDTTLQREDAREALAFWTARRSRLPWYRRAARAEARTMVWRWRARLLEASLEQAHLGFLARWLGAFGFRLVRRARRLLFAALAATAVAVLAAGAFLGFIAAQLF